MLNEQEKARLAFLRNEIREGKRDREEVDRDLRRLRLDHIMIRCTSGCDCFGPGFPR